MKPTNFILFPERVSRRGWSADRTEAERHGRLRLACTSRRQPPTQRRSVGMGLDLACTLVDLPVDGVVILERQERAGEIERGERAARERQTER